MGEKSIQKKKYIVDTARGVFIEKGYLKVTMKDVVEACDISRGGLYLYYDSVKELFLDVLKAEEEASEDVFGSAIANGLSASDILGLFLTEQKKEILTGKNSLTVSIYEYYYENEMPEGEHPYKNQFAMSVKVVEQLIRQGNEQGDFYCLDTLGAARNIMYVVEGMKAASVTMGITEEEVNNEILYLLKGLMMDESDRGSY